MSDMTEHPDHDAMAALYDRAIETTIAKHIVGRLAHCHLIERLTGDNTRLAFDMVNDPGAQDACKAEFDALTEPEIEELQAQVRSYVQPAFSDAIMRLWHACTILELDPEDIDPRYVALVASTLISEKPESLK